MALNDEQRALLSIEEKEDTAEKLAFAQGKPTKNFLFAPEFNAVKRAINLLHNMMALTAQNVLAAIGDDRLDLDEIGDVSIIDYFDNFDGVGVELGVSGARYITYLQNGLLRVYAFVGTPGFYGLDTLQLEESDLLTLFIEDYQGNTYKEFVGRIDGTLNPGGDGDISNFYKLNDEILDITWSFPQAGRLRATSPQFTNPLRLLATFDQSFGARLVIPVYNVGYIDFIGFLPPPSSGQSNTNASFDDGKLKIELYNNAATVVVNPE